MFRTLANIARLARAARVLAAHDALIPKEYAPRVPPALRWLRAALSRKGAARGAGTPGERLAAALERLGPAYIKLGQLLATRPDLVGGEVARGLEALQDRLPPFPMEAARAAIAEEFGRPASEIFASLDPPIAAASIAQVHRAATPGGGAVAVKILRPGIEEQFARDLRAFAFAARLAERFSAEARRLRLRALVDTLAASVALELDLRMEAAAASELAERTAGDKDFRVPAVDWERTSGRVLTTAWMEGIALRDPAALSAAGHDPRLVATRIVRTFLTQALRDGFFHADMHPGNLFLDAEGRICAVDFGIMGRLDARMRRFMAETLGGFLARDYRRVAEVHYEVDFVPRVHPVETFAQALRAIGEPIFGKPAREVSMARLLQQLFDTTRRFDMELQPQLVLLQKTMVVVEGVARSLDPDHDIWESSRPVIEKWMVENLGPEARLRDAADGVTALGRLVQDLPELLRNAELVAAMLAEGGLKLHPDSARAIGEARAARTRHVRIALWIAAGALGLIALGQL